MEVVIPVQSMDFDFNNTKSSPYLSNTAPSSPRRFGECFFSAPTSPTRMSEFYRDFDNFLTSNNRTSTKNRSVQPAIPFDWEEKPGTPKSPHKATAAANDFEDDFAFHISSGGQSDEASLSAEELFVGGKIRPLKPPPRLHLEEQETIKSPFLSPKSPKLSPLSQGKKIICEALSPRRKKHIDPFETAVVNSKNRTSEQERGRGRSVVNQGSSTSSSRRTTRSLSPFKVSAYPWEEEEEEKLHPQQTTKLQPSSSNSKPPISSSTSSAAAYTSSKSSSRKWSFRDFLLFRSASEGRATEKDQLRKYSVLFRKPEDTKNSSFRSKKSRGHAVSAHELHYTMNKAASEDLKKKTFLPYKQGILGRFAFNPAVHSLANRS